MGRINEIYKNLAREHSDRLPIRKGLFLPNNTIIWDDESIETWVNRPKSSTICNEDIPRINSIVSIIKCDRGNKQRLQRVPS